MPITSPKRKLDDKECFDLWLKTGSLSKVSKYLERNGKINEDTGKPFTTMGIRFASLRYLVEHPEEAKERFEEVDPHSSYLANDNTWNNFLAKKACEVYVSREERCYRWAEDHDVPKKFVTRYL